MNTHPVKREAAETQKVTSMRESGPGEVVVSRTDLEAVLADCYGDSAEKDRLRAVLDQGAT